jgi:hypothetical protein
MAGTTLYNNKKPEGAASGFLYVLIEQSFDAFRSSA